MRILNAVNAVFKFLIFIKNVAKIITIESFKASVIFSLIYILLNLFTPIKKAIKKCDLYIYIYQHIN